MMNIYQKIIKVMESITHLQKDDTIGTGSNKYKGISDEKVKKEIRSAMIKNGLVMFRTNVEEEVTSREYEDQYKKAKIQHFVKVKSTYKIVNVESPEESIEIQSIGHGVDAQDKAAGKAMTYASKYAMLDTFIIPTGEDADKIHSDDIEVPVSSNNKKSTTQTKETNKVEKTKESEKPKTENRNYKKELGTLIVEMYGKENATEGLKKLTGKDDLKTLTDREAEAELEKLSNAKSIISDKQKNRLFAIAKGRGLDEKATRTFIKDMFKFISTKLLTQKQYKELIEQIEKLPEGGA